MIFDNTMTLLEAGMTARRHRQSLTAGNIANADTPGYRARKVDFRETLRQVAGEGLPAGSEPMDARLRSATRIDKTPGRADGNNINMEAEVATEVANAMEYQALATLTRKKFSLMRLATSS